MSKSGQFEKSITELEAIVAQLEKGELDLDDALKQFEKGVSLARVCQDTLRKAEQTIELLSLNPAKHDDDTVNN
jgi:exodeoxyribonuclease VII small subunit